jgi:hypothetical protein
MTMSAVHQATDSSVSRRSSSSLTMTARSSKSCRHNISLSPTRGRCQDSTYTPEHPFFVQLSSVLPEALRSALWLPGIFPHLSHL